MSIARHHAEWLSLIEVSGPFLSMPVLLRAFPDGLDLRADAPEHRVRLHSAYEEWLDNQGGLAQDPAIHRAWARFVLREALEIEDLLLAEGQAIPASCSVAVAEHQERLSPDLVVVDPPGRASAGAPRILITVVPTSQRLDSPMAGVRWKASPATRMMTLLHGASGQGSPARLGVVTNGEQWMLVHAAPGETTTYASFYASLFFDEPLTLRAFESLLGSRRCFGVPDPDTLEVLFRESSANQQDLTDQLGAQVRRAVEVLIHTIDRIDRDRGRQLLHGVDVKVLYEAAVTVMMRLVFLFAAEERGLLLLGDPLFDQHYAVSTLRDQLQTVADQHGEEVLKRRHDAWSRLLATFRAVFGGVRHESMRLPAYGGSLFDPDRFPFLEGRAPGTSWQTTEASPLAIDNLTVLDLLSSLQILRVKVPGGGPAEARRLSFRALDVEQIGHVYEGLLDHTAKRAPAPVLGLKGSKDREPETEITRLEELARGGKEALIAFLAEETGRTEAALRKGMAYEIDADYRRHLMRVCDNQETLYGRIEPWAGLIREDEHGDPIIFDQGAVYVTDGAERRATGTHYTPKSLTEPIVQHTLEPLVYEGPAEGLAKEQWKLRSAKEILALRVCDLAMGSGAFLVQACRYLSEQLAEAWEDAESAAGGRLVITPEGELGTGNPFERALPRDPDERLALARRYVADRCLYGVDKNPMAVEMAKLSLWLVTLQKDRPFTFVDHALRCGDSLAGVTDPAQVERFHLDPERGRRIHNTNQGWTRGFGDALQRALELREQIERTDATSAAEVYAKQDLLKRAETALSDARLISDCVVGAAIQTAEEDPAAYDEALVMLSRKVSDALAARIRSASEGDHRVEELRAATARLGALDASGQRRTFFHWALEYPEIFRGNPTDGFDAIVSNPPFKGGSHLATLLGSDYRRFIVTRLANGVSGTRGQVDLVAYFFLRACALIRSRRGFAGLIATNTISQGDTREASLDQIVSNGHRIFRAQSSMKWPGPATTTVSVVFICDNGSSAHPVLDGRDVTEITTTLSSAEAGDAWIPRPLAANSKKVFLGAKPYGPGFVLTAAERSAMVADDPASAAVIEPYLIGKDITDNAAIAPRRWIINFRDWPLDAEHAPNGYAGPFAVNYSAAHRRVDQLVRPKRQLLGGYATAESRAKKWWLFSNDARSLYTELRGLRRCLACSQTSKYVFFMFFDTKLVFDQKTVVAAFDTGRHFVLLNSAIHQSWAFERGLTHGVTPVYTASSCFATFPLPAALPTEADALGDELESRIRAVAGSRRVGLTDVLNLVHGDPGGDSEVVAIRGLLATATEIVGRAYGWVDLDYSHARRLTKAGERFTIAETERKKVLVRLARLNQERHAVESAKGVAVRAEPTSEADTDEETAGEPQAAVAAVSAQTSLFGPDPKPGPRRTPGGRR